MDTKIRKLFITLLFSFFSSIMPTMQEDFLRANKEYTAGNWQKALEIYDSLDSKGEGVWYNMGNCHYQLQDYPKALVCWNRSLKNASYKNVDDICANMDQALHKCGILEAKYTSPTWLLKLSLAIPYILLQLLFLMCWYGLFFAWFKGAGLRRRFLILGMSIFGVLTCGGLLFVAHRSYFHSKAVVLQSCHLFAGPHEKLDVVDTVDQAELVEVSTKRGNWYKVTSSRSSGCISTDNIEVI